jgi:lipopolysaccharide transport system ATP-binding protein
MSTIEVRNLSKKYIISSQSHINQTLRDKFFGSFKVIKNYVSEKKVGKNEEFWALKNINFSVNQGEIIGIIGSNGAGKSTLLKILSKITPPTKGEIKIKGKVASLLDVGTGFHPELSGRENIYLNGVILGMSKKQIDKKFKEILEFSGVEKFLEVPVKHYSSGMYMRLAFSVAACMETDILMIDEALAVGDAKFQKKCLGKIHEISKSEGRTVLFVSHNMNAIEDLCKKVLLLKGGKILMYSEDTRKVIKEYLFSGGEQLGVSEWVNMRNEYNNQYFKPIKISLTDKNNQRLKMPIRNDTEVWFQVEGEIREIDNSLTVGYAVFNEDGNMLYLSYQTDGREEMWPKLRKGLNMLKSQLPKRLFNEGIYRIELVGGLHYKQWLYEPGTSVPSVYLNIKGGLSDSPYWMVRRQGIIAPEMTWESNINI